MAGGGRVNDVRRSTLFDEVGEASAPSMLSAHVMPALAVRLSQPRLCPARARSRLTVAASGQKSISVVRQASAAEVSRLGCKSWPTWSCGVSHFPWTYGEQETSLLIEGAVTVTPDGGEPVALLAGDMATFPAGLSCVWYVTQPLRKHYSFDA